MEEEKQSLIMIAVVSAAIALGIRLLGARWGDTIMYFLLLFFMIAAGWYAEERNRLRRQIREIEKRLEQHD